MDDEKFICHKCVREKYVSLIIKQKGDAKHKCSYCRKKIKNIELLEITNMMNRVFTQHYDSWEDTDNYYTSRAGESAQNIIQDQLGVNEKVAIDIHELLKETYNDYFDDFNSAYRDDYVYRIRNYISNSHELNNAWDEMKESLQGEARFFNRQVKLFLDNLFSDIETLRTDISQPAITTIDSDSILYRARSFENYDSVEEALKHPELHFGPPPHLLARSGRMNAHGIPVFYGATSPDIAVSEIRPAVGNFVIVTPFRPRRPLRILDITALDALSYIKGSLFDTKLVDMNEKTSFLKTLSRKLTLPVSGKNPDSEYLITQAVAEYLAISEKYNLDGISFESTQVRIEEKNKNIAHNVVLFSKSSHVKDADTNSNYIVDLYENIEEDEYIFHPTIRKIEGESKTHYNSHFLTDTQDETLEIIPDKIIFYKIKGVIFQTEETEVTLGETIIQDKPKHKEYDGKYSAG